MNTALSASWRIVSRQKKRRPLKVLIARLKINQLVFILFFLCIGSLLIDYIRGRTVYTNKENCKI